MLSMREEYLRENIRFVVDVQQALSRGELASAMGVSPQAVSQLISGSTKTLKPINLVKAARKIGAPVERLVMEDLRAVPDFGRRPIGYGIAEPIPTYKNGPLSRLFSAASEAAEELPSDFFDRMADAIMALTRRHSAQSEI